MAEGFGSGLLDFINTPAGQGLLSAAFTGAAAARRGAPWNTLGAAGLGGLSGYLGAQDRAAAQANAELQRRREEQKLGMQNAIFARFGGLGAQAVQNTPAASESQPVGAGQTSIAADSQPSARTGGSFPLALNDVAALKAIGGPDFFDLYKYANDGVKREAGNYYVDPTSGNTTYMPRVPEGATVQNGRVVAMPGAAETNAAYQGAQTRANESAKAGYDFVNVPRADGSTMMVRRDQAAGYAGTAGGIGVTQSPQDQAYGADLAKASAEQYKQIQNAGFTAPGKIAKYQQLGQLLADHEGGKLSATGMQISQLGNSLGINIDKKLANKEAAQALTNELALALRDTSAGGGMPGAMSDDDRKFLQASVPNLSQSAEGRRQMIDMQTKVLSRQVDVARMARQWQQRYGRVDAVNPVTGKSFFDNLAEWSERNALFPQPAQQPAPAGVSGSW